jgi:hypothetical protein
MAYQSWKKKTPENAESNVFRLRDELAIPRQVTDYHLKIQPYLSLALLSAYNGNNELANENRYKLAYYFLSQVTTTIMLPDVRILWEAKNPEDKDIKKFILSIASYAKDHTRTSQLLDMYLSYADILSEAGLLEAYNRRQSAEEAWEDGF